MKVKVINKSGFELPMYKTKGSAGFDFVATEDSFVGPHSRSVINTGLYVALEPGYELQVRPRSGLAAKSGITVLNSPGTIDSDYRGEIGVILYNTGNHRFDIKAGDRIAQGVVAKYEQIEWVSVDVLDETERGEGGFGSTGV